MGNMMMAQMVGMLGKMLPPPEKPENEVAVFVSEEIANLLGNEPDIMGMIHGAVVGLANSDPNATLRTLVEVHNHIGAFVAKLRAEEEGAEDANKE